MICRLWRGWATLEKADEYERIVRRQVIPGIEARRIAGFHHIDLMRRPMAGDAEVEFATLMWFSDLNAIIAFVGPDYETSHVPAAARALLDRFDARAAHFEVLDRRPQNGQSAA